ncbi:MAG: carboxypeptidase regulatory-like domain-containing protein [Bryobacteraceae bacterium]
MKRLRRARGTVVLCLLSAFLDTAAVAAVLRGTVVANRTGRPLARSQVKIEAVNKGAPGTTRSALTGSAGEFVFENLPAGAYFVSASRPGFAPAKYGQQRWNTQGTPVVLEASSAFAAEIRLKKLGVITGTVLDENQVGFTDHSVHVYQAGTRLTLVAGAQTNDAGTYRIAGLKPGKYYVRTGSKELEDKQGLLPTYFGQTLAAKESRPVEVALDEERDGIDISPIPGKLVSVRGTLHGSAATVALYGDTGRREQSVPAGGAFAFDQLAPGEYQLVAESGSGENLLTAYQTISASRPVENVLLQLAPAPRVRITCTERHGAPLDTRTVSVFIRRKEPPEEQSRRAACGQDVALPPGAWDVAAHAPAGFYVSAVSGATVAENSHEFTLASDRKRELNIVLSSQPAILAGTVQTQDGSPAIGAPVFLKASDADVRSRLGGVTSVRTDQDGKYRFPGVPPGTYEAISSFDLESGGDAEWEPGSGKSITLEEDADATLDLPLTQLN